MSGGGSAGFLAMEVKLDLDRAEGSLKSLGKLAKSELGKPIPIDTASFRELANVLAGVEKSYADTLAIVTRMNTSTANLVRATKAVGDAARYSNGEAARSVQLAKEQERTRRAELAVQAQQVKAEGALAAVQATAAGKADYLTRQQEAAAAVAASKRQALDLERQHKATMAEADAAQKAASAALKAHKSEVLSLTKEIAKAEKEVTAEQAAQAVEVEKQVGLLRASLRTATAGVDWGVTAIGAAQARNYGYSVGAVIQMGKAMASSLRAVPAAAMAATAAVAAIAVAAVATAAAVGTLAVKISKLGASEAVGTESLINQLNTLLPTAAMAKAEVEGLFELGTRTVAPTATLIELDTRLLRAGGAAAALRVELLEGFGAFSTAAQLTTEQMNSLNYLIGEVALKGRMMRVDMMQFPSAGLGQIGFLEEAAKAAGRTVQELSAEISGGTFTTRQFVEGLIAYFGSFEGGAAAAAAAVAILRDNTKDAWKSGIGLAFYNEGVTSALSKFWLAVSGIVKSLIPTFSVIGDAVARFIATVVHGFSLIGGSGGGGVTGFFVTLFGQVIPAAINMAATAVGWLLRGLSILWPAIQVNMQVGKELVRTMFLAVGGAAGLARVGKLVAGGLVVMVGMVTVTLASLRAFIGLAQGAAFAVVALWRALHGDFGGAESALMSAVGAVAAGFTDAKNAVVGFRDAVKGAMRPTPAAEKPVIKDLGKTPPGTLPPREDEAKSGGGKGSNAATESARKLASALAELWEQTRRWLGQRSALEKSLLGAAEGFTATADQIIDTGIRLIKTLDEAGFSKKSALVVAVKREVVALAKLAQQRDKLQKKLEDQQDSLRQLQGDRSAMSASIAQSLNAFVWALRTESDTITEYTRLDAVGSFTLVQKKTTKSWVSALGERLTAVRKFISDIRALRAAGLNAETIRQLVEAGPEAAAAAVAELSAGGAETIAAVNAIQSEMASLSESFGEEQAGSYYDAGVAAAEALVAGTKAALAEVVAQAEALSTSVQERMAAIAKPAKDAGAAAGAAFGEAFGSSANATIADLEISAWPSVGGGEVSMPTLSLGGQDFEATGRSLVDGLVSGFKTRLGETDWGGILRTAFTFINGGGILAFLGSETGQGFINGLKEKVTTIKESIGGWLTTYVVDPVKKFFGIASPSTLFKGFGGDVVQGLIDGIKKKFTDNPVINFFKDAFEASMDWLKGEGKYKNTGLPGAVRGALSELNLSVNFDKLKSSAKEAMKGGVNQVLKGWNDLKFTFPKVEKEMWGKKVTIGGWTVDTPNIPLLAAGGVTRGPMLAGIGEAGSEAVLPLTNSRAMAAIAEAINRGRGESQGSGSWHFYLGDKEITDLVRTELRAADGRRVARAYAGRGF